jgi:PAS domain-containing protein
MHRLVAPQLALARDAEGAIDGELLAPLVEATDADFERDRRRMDRTSALTVEALSEANGRLVQTADALRVQNRLLNAALGNMSQGLCLADAAGRRLMGNTRLTAMFGLPPPTEPENPPAPMPSSGFSQ